MFFNRKKQENQKEKKQEFAALFFPLALLLLLKKKLDERSKMKEKKIQIIHYLKFERIFVRPEKKENKNHCDLFAQLKKKILRRSKVWGMGGRGTGFCWLPRPRPSPNLAGHTHLHCLTSLSVSSCRQGQK